MTHTIDWAITRDRSVTLRVCQDVSVAVLGGLAVVAGVGLLAWVTAQALQGNVVRVLFALLLALLGGPFSLLYLLPMLSDADQRPDRSQFLPLPHSPQTVGGLAVAGAVVLGVTTVVSPLGAILLVCCVVFGLVPLAGLLGTAGTFDVDTRTLTVDDRTGSLDALTGVHRASVGRITVLWLSYARGTGHWTAPRLVVLPTDIERRLRTHLSAAVAEPVDPAQSDDARRSNRTVQATLVTFALLFVGVAVGQFFVADLPTVIALWASSLMALFALVFLWLAVQEG